MKSTHFNIIRCLIALVHMDQRTPHEKELAIIRNFAFRQGMTPEQRKILKAEVLSSKANVFDIFSSLDDQLDREKTLSVARVILHIDGTFTPEEQQIYARLQEVHKQKPIDQLGKELISRDKRFQFYDELQEMGEHLSQKSYRIWMRFSPYLYWRNWRWSNRPLFWFLIILIGVSAAARMLLPHLLK